jgi:hypothetical protein
MEIRKLVKNKFKSAEYFTFTGVWIYFIILNSASSQLPNYIFPIMSLIAVITAKWIDEALNENHRLLKTFSISQRFVNLLLWAGIFVIVFYLFPKPDWYIWIIIFAGIGLSSYISNSFKEKSVHLLLSSIIVFTTLFLVLNVHVFPYMFGFQAPPKAARYFTEYAAKKDRLYNYKYKEFELYFYSEPEATKLITKEEMLNVAGKSGNWIFTDAEGYKEIEQLNLVPDLVMEYKHLYLNRGGRFINPRTRDLVLQPMYLIKY